MTGEQQLEILRHAVDSVTVCLFAVVCAWVVVRLIASDRFR